MTEQAPAELWLRRDGERERAPLSDRLLGRGADARIVRFADGSPRVAKLYHDPDQDPQRPAKLAAMLANRPELAAPAQPGEIRLAWPEGLLEDARGRFVGYAMPLVDLAHASTLENLLSRRTRAASGLPERYAARVRAAYELARLVAALHAQGHHVIDLKPQNIHVYTGTLAVALLDTDGFSVLGADGRRFPGHQYTDGYIAPEAMRNGLRPEQLGEAQDDFALAVLIFRLLNNGLHPFQGVPAVGRKLPGTDSERVKEGLYAYGVRPNRAITASPWSVHESFDSATRALFDRAFTGSERPGAAEWAAHLARFAEPAHGRLIACDQNPDHAHFGLGCGWCALRARRQAHVAGRPTSGGRHPSAGAAPGPVPASPGPAPAPRPFTTPAPPPKNRRVWWIGGAVVAILIGLAVMEYLQLPDAQTRLRDIAQRSMYNARTVELLRKSLAGEYGEVDPLQVRFGEYDLLEYVARYRSPEVFLAVLEHWDGSFRANPEPWLQAAAEGGDATTFLAVYEASGRQELSRSVIAALARRIARREWGLIEVLVPEATDPDAASVAWMLQHGYRPPDGLGTDNGMLNAALCLSLDRQWARAATRLIARTPHEPRCAKDGIARTPLSYALHYRLDELTRQLLDEPGIAFDTDELLHAVAKGGGPLLEAVLKRGLKLDQRGHVDGEAHTPLTLAARRGDPDMLIQLLDKGARIDYPTEDARTPLMHAALGGHASTVRPLLARKADPWKRDREGFTPYLLAASSGDDESVGLLSPYATEDDRLRALIYFSLSGNAGRVADLLERKSIPQRILDDSLLFALSHRGATINKVEIVERLLRRGARPGEGSELLYVLVETRLPAEDVRAIVDLLAAHGLSLAERLNGRTVLTHAIEFGRCDLVPGLVEARADPEQRDANGRTALAFQILSAVYPQEMGRPAYADCVDLLLTAGADPNGASADGDTPLTLLAARFGWQNTTFVGAGMVPEKDVLAAHSFALRHLARAGADLERPGRGGDKPVVVALRENRWDFINYAADLGADMCELLRARRRLSQESSQAARYSSNELERQLHSGSLIASKLRGCQP